MEKTAVIVDANVALSASINPEGPTHRKLLTLLLDPRVVIYAPRYLIDEISPKIQEIAARKRLDADELHSTLSLFLSVFNTVDNEEYKSHVETAQNYVYDPGDTPYVALALHLKKRHRQVMILTYNVDDYKVAELAEIGILVTIPSDINKRLEP